jgi:hypothetical protein
MDIKSIGKGMTMFPCALLINWSASRPCHSIHEEIVPSVDWIGGRVGPKAGVNSMETNPRSIHIRGKECKYLGVGEHLKFAFTRKKNH